MNLEGKLLGNRYEIIEKIGNGGMATVYKATDKVLKRNVAVKILRDEFTTDDEFIKRFEVEAQSAARLTHPNIVSIYDVGVDGNLYYIVMELIQGKTLKEIIVKEKGPLPWKWSINVSIQIASALEMAHRNNIIHRDIKPHNIIITEDGVAKVTDFGIAKAVSNSTITAFGTTIGSVHYFSPEHARGGFTDAKSDLYSLGVVMYEMVTGRVPFDADTPVSVALKHMQEEPVEPIELNLIVVHLGSGITVGVHKKGKVVDVNNALNGDGPFTTNRAGSIDATNIIDLCFSGKYTKDDLYNLITKRGGLVSLLETNDIREVIKMIQNGNKYAQLVLNAMIYQIAKQIGAMSINFKGNIDAIIITGAIANSKYFVLHLREYIDFLGKVIVMPGDMEMEALVNNTLQVMKGKKIILNYTGESMDYELPNF